MLIFLIYTIYREIGKFFSCQKSGPAMKKWQGSVLQQTDAAVSACCAGDGGAVRLCHGAETHGDIQTYSLRYRKNAALAVICGNAGNAGHSLAGCRYCADSGYRDNGHRKGNVNALCTYFIAAGVRLTKNIAFEYFVAPQCCSLISMKFQPHQGFMIFICNPPTFCEKALFFFEIKC